MLAFRARYSFKLNNHLRWEFGGFMIVQVAKLLMSKLGNIKTSAEPLEHFSELSIKRTPI